MQIKLREILDQKRKSIYQLNKETVIDSSNLSHKTNNKTNEIQ